MDTKLMEEYFKAEALAWKAYKKIKPQAGGANRTAHISAWTLCKKEPGKKLGGDFKLGKRGISFENWVNLGPREQEKYARENAKKKVLNIARRYCTDKEKLEKCKEGIGKRAQKKL